MKVEDGEEITYEMASDAMKRGAYFLEAIQASDGHWPSETSGPLFYLCPLLICMYIMGFMDSAFSPEHKKEMMRYLYNHQVAILNLSFIRFYFQFSINALGSCVLYLDLFLNCDMSWYISKRLT